MSIFNSINDIVSKQLANVLMESLGLTGKGGPLSGILGGGGGGGGGGWGGHGQIPGSAGGGLIGWLGGLGSQAGGWLSGLFGGGAAAGFTPGFASMVGMGLATGTNYVPHDMLQLIHEGEAVVPKKYNPAAGGSGGSQMVSQSFHFAGPVDRRTAMQVGADAQRGLLAARRNL
jgi:hypothetical protein